MAPERVGEVRHGVSSVVDVCRECGVGSAIRSATSVASTGWNREPVGPGISGSFASALATIRIRSWNWPTVFDLWRPVAGLARRAPPASEEPRPDDRCQLPHRRQSPFRARLAAPGADPHRPPENLARLLQIVGANGGNGVSKAIPRHIVDAIAGANLP